MTLVWRGIDTDNMSLASNLSTRKSFYNFAVKHSNLDAFMAAFSVIQNPIKYSPLFLYGESGVGKTHLLKAIAREFKRIHRKPVLYATAENFCKELIFAIRNKQRESFDNKYRNNSLLIIDDIQFVAGRQTTQQELLTILKEFQVKDQPIILSANRHPYWIYRLEKDLAESCFGGLLLEIKK